MVKSACLEYQLNYISEMKFSGEFGVVALGKVAAETEKNHVRLINLKNIF